MSYFVDLLVVLLIHVGLSLLALGFLMIIRWCLSMVIRFIVKKWTKKSPTTVDLIFRAVYWSAVDIVLLYNVAKDAIRLFKTNFPIELFSGGYFGFAYDIALCTIIIFALLYVWYRIMRYYRDSHYRVLITAKLKRTWLQR